MASLDIFNKVPIKVPNRSGFDLSHENLLTMTPGTLVPVMCDLLYPGDSVSLGSAFEVQLPPMATDFYGRVRFRMEAFFVPCRQLYGGWQKFMTMPTGSFNTAIPPVTNPTLPYVVVSSDNSSVLGRGSLADYLGYKGSSNTAVRINNILRFAAYHKIYDDWYRDSRLQKPCFQTPGQGALTLSLSTLPFYTYGDPSNANIPYANFICSDGVSGFTLRQRNYPRDYFTNATTLPQSGTAASLSFDVSDSSGSFTISSLRAANSLQMWLERNNIAGARYADQIKAHFGVMPSDAVTQRAVYLGSSQSVIYNHSVYQTNNDADVAVACDSPNPFNSVGSKFSSPIGTDKNSLVDKFTTTEHGYFMVIASIVPDSIYSTGVNRDFFKSKVGDFAWPLLQGIGDQPIYKAELSRNGIDGTSMDDMSTFGYTQRYSDLKYMPDEVHGGLVDGEQLQAFALQRSFGSVTSISLGSDFIQIPQTCLDQVAASTQAVPSQYGAWADIYFNYRKITAFSAYTIPTLGDPKDTHTEVVPNGGRRL